MADNSDTTKMHLTNDITITNSTGTHKFRAGQNIEVPKAMAEDVERMDYEHNKYLKTLHTKRTFERDAGTISAGGGAE